MEHRPNMQSAASIGIKDVGHEPLGSQASGYRQCLIVVLAAIIVAVVTVDVEGEPPAYIGHTCRVQANRAFASKMLHQRTGHRQPVAIRRLSGCGFGPITTATIRPIKHPNARSGQFHRVIGPSSLCRPRTYSARHRPSPLEKIMSCLVMSGRVGSGLVGASLVLSGHVPSGPVQSSRVMSCQVGSRSCGITIHHAACRCKRVGKNSQIFFRGRHRG